MSDNLDQVSAELRSAADALDKTARDVLDQASRRVGARAVGTYMRDAGFNEGGPMPPNTTPKLRIVSGRLARSLTRSRGRHGAPPEGIDEVKKISEHVFRLIKGSKVPYAALHEYGGVTHPRVTAKSRRFFWAMYAKTNKDKWKWMALTKKNRFTVRIARRAYLHPALQDELANLRKLAEGELLTLINRSFGAA